MNIGAIPSSHANYEPVLVSRGAFSHETVPQGRLGLPPVDFPTRSSLERDTASFASDVGKKFLEAGIPSTPAVVLTGGADGHVRVANRHPDGEAIERLFRDNPELQQRFAKISAGSSALRAGESYLGFSREYARLQGDPSVQAALVSAETARNQASFFLTIGSSGATPFFGLAGARG